ncbi:MAG: endonuclease/exonuclease/phosphatase family protein [Candidatus Hydrogenedentes bacterium]|nr:endonuclease/exonuclease/phosphatase family protein [Candidatus Hydrogenedentota bacterium]
MVARGLGLLALLVAGTDREVYADTMKTTTIKVLTFNILHGATMKKDGNLDVVAQVILDLDPDLVALQEVDVRTGRVGGQDLATQLGHRTRLHPLFARAMAFDGGEYGVAILSRYSFRSTRAIPLPSSPDNEPRVALEAVLDLPDGPSIAFVATHLDNASKIDRAAQARMINQEFGKRDLPRLLAGDFNATPDSETVTILKESWTPTDGLDAPPTFPSNKPEIKIDYVFFSPRERWVAKETRVIENTLASDHFALLCTLEFSTP